MRGAVRAFHLSFLDFLKHQTEQTTDWIRLTDIHVLMANSCLDILLQELKLNICRLEDASYLNKDIPDILERVDSYVSQELQYSALFWMTHINKSGAPFGHGSVAYKISQFLCNEKALYWLEVMSLIDAIDRSIVILSEFHQVFLVVGGYSQ